MKIWYNNREYNIPDWIANTPLERELKWKAYALNGIYIE